MASASDYRLEMMLDELRRAQDPVSIRRPTRQVQAGPFTVPQMDIFGTVSDAYNRAKGQREAPALKQALSQQIGQAEQVEQAAAQQEYGLKRSKYALELAKFYKQDPKSAVGKLQGDLRSGLINQQEYDDMYSKLTHVGPLVTVNTGQDNYLNEPLSDAAMKWVDAEGNHPPPGWTGAQAEAAGFSPASAAEQKRVSDVSGAVPLVAGIAKLGFEPTGQSRLFPPEDDSLMQRGIEAGTAIWNDITQNPEHSELIRFNDNKKASLASLARLTGENGVLSNPDIERVMDLYPIPGWTPDNVARDKFMDIREHLLAAGAPRDLIDRLFPDLEALEQQKQEERRSAMPEPIQRDAGGNPVYNFEDL